MLSSTLRMTGEKPLAQAKGQDSRTPTTQAVTRGQLLATWPQPLGLPEPQPRVQPWGCPTEGSGWGAHC